MFGVLRSHRFPLVAVFRLQLSCLRIPSPSSGIYSVVILQLTCIKCGQKQHFVASCRLCPFHQHRLFWPGSTPLFKVTDSSSVICLLRARSLDGVIVAPENECENSQSCVSVLFCVFFFFYQDRQASYLCCSLTFFAWKTFAVLSHSFLPGWAMLMVARSNTPCPPSPPPEILSGLGHLCWDCFGEGAISVCGDKMSQPFSAPIFKANKSLWGVWRVDGDLKFTFPSAAVRE